MTLMQNIQTTPPVAEHDIQVLQDRYKADIEAVNTLILGQIKKHIPLIEDIAVHILQAGGKRARPLLCLMVANMFGAPTSELRTGLAACIEYVHTATLLHDDVIDHSVLRRGLKTANTIWGNKSSILVGDFLFSRAFELIVQTGKQSALACLSAATRQITEGELLQLSVEGDVGLTEETYLRIIGQKTASLFGASAQLGAIAGEADAATQKQVYGFGEALGYLYQLVDDILDYFHPSHVTGKTHGNDFFEGKITLPVIRLYAAATPSEQQEIRGFFELKKRTPEMLNTLHGLMEKYAILNAMRLYVQQAVCQGEEGLAHLPPRGQQEGKMLLQFFGAREF